VEGSGRGLIWGTVQEFTWRVWRKSWKISVGKVDIQTDNRTGHHPNRNQKCCLLSELALCHNIEQYLKWNSHVILGSVCCHVAFLRRAVFFRNRQISIRTEIKCTTPVSEQTPNIKFHQYLLDSFEDERAVGWYSRLLHALYATISLRAT
jgi:hypothetical protein